MLQQALLLIILAGATQALVRISRLTGTFLVTLVTAVLGFFF